jgi:hypothetical protein
MKSILLSVLICGSLPSLAWAGSSPVLPPPIPPLPVQPPQPTEPAPPPISSAPVVEPPPPPLPDITRNSTVQGGSVGEIDRVLRLFVRNNPNTLLRGLVAGDSTNPTPPEPSQVRFDVTRNLASRNLVSGANDPQIIFNQFPPFGGTNISPNNRFQVPPIVIPPINF